MTTTKERTTCARCEEHPRSALHPCPNLPTDWEWRCDCCMVCEQACRREGLRAAKEG